LSAFQPMECKLCYAPPYYPNNGSFFSLFVPFYFALFCSVHFEIFKFTLKIIEWLNEFLSSHKYLLTSVKVYLYMLESPKNLNEVLTDQIGTGLVKTRGTGKHTDVNLYLEFNLHEICPIKIWKYGNDNALHKLILDMELCLGT
jgi:hypothetical protein